MAVPLSREWDVPINKKIDAKERQKIRAWKAARALATSTYGTQELLVIEKFEDALNLAACHLTLGVRGLVLAQTLLCNRLLTLASTHLPSASVHSKRRARSSACPTLGSTIKLTAGGHRCVSRCTRRWGLRPLTSTTPTRNSGGNSTWPLRPIALRQAARRL